MVVVAAVAEVILVGVVITAEIILIRVVITAEVILVGVVITGETEDRKGDDHKKKRTVKGCRM